MKGDINADKFNCLIADETTVADLSQIIYDQLKCDKIDKIVEFDALIDIVIKYTLDMYNSSVVTYISGFSKI